MRYLILILLFPVTVQAQSVSVGHSFEFWGKAKYLNEISISHSSYAIHYFYSNDNTSYFAKINNEIVDVGQKQNTFALSWTPISYRYIFTGLMISNKRFPTNKGNKLNFIIGIEVPIKRFTFSYRHISNGFGIHNPVNLGVDTINISYSLKGG